MVVEQNSPAIMPESDELWSGLIERDFPDRPSKPKNALVGTTDDDMPNKLLYERYGDEREQLRASSAQRLRKMTQKLQKEKSKNSIVPIQGIMREPVIRRRIPTMSLAPLTYSKYGSKSILGKAMKDVQHRHLMFKGSIRSDPFAAFSAKKNENDRRRAAEPRVASFSVSDNGPTGIYSQKPLGNPTNNTKTTNAKPARTSPSRQRSPPSFTNELIPPPTRVVPQPPGVVSPQKSTSPKETSPNPESRKRKATSVFLSSKRLPRAPRIPADRPRTPETREEKPVERPGTQKAVRSLIFY